MQVSTGYTVSDLKQVSGGTVLFTSNPVTETNVVIRQHVRNRRTTNYPGNGALPAKVVNDDIDRLWLVQQTNSGDLSNAIRIPVTKSPGVLLLAADRLGKAAIFDPVRGKITVSDVAFNDQIDIVSGLTGYAAAQAALAAQLAANADGSVTDAAGSAGAALNAADYLNSYMDQVAMNVNFPLDFGLIADPVINNTFDLETL